MVLSEVVAGVLVVEGDEQHGAGGDEAAAGAEAVDPAIGVEGAVEVDINATVAERDGVNAGGGSAPWV